MTEVLPPREISCFKAYDLRGILNGTIDEDITYRVGRAFVDVVNANSVVVGYDARASSQELAARRNHQRVLTLMITICPRALVPRNSRELAACRDLPILLGRPLLSPQTPLMHEKSCLHTPKWCSGSRRCFSIFLGVLSLLKTTWAA